MMIKSLQWNIGGGIIRNKEDDPFVDNSYHVSNLNYIADFIKKLDPDLITLQETHASSELIQAELLSRLTGLHYWVNDAYDHSHLEAGQRLGQAILSKYPIQEHTFELFYNPKYKVERPNGETWFSHDKGLSKCKIEINGVLIEIQTLHLIPFRTFTIDPMSDQAQTTREDITKKIHSSFDRIILQGDFNINQESLHTFIPDVFEIGFDEILSDRATTPAGCRYDHILFKGFQVKSMNVFQTTLTDHYPVSVEFETK